MKKNLLKKIVLAATIGLVANLFTGCFLFTSERDERAKKEAHFLNDFVPVPKTKYAVVIINSEPSAEEKAQFVKVVKQLNSNRAKAVAEGNEYAKERKDLSVDTLFKDWKEIYDKAIESLSSANNIIVLDRTKIDSIKKEHEFQLSDWSSPKKTAAVGQALNADCVVYIKIDFEAGSAWGAASSKQRYEFLDINTMEKQVIENQSFVKDKIQALTFKGRKIDYKPDYLIYSAAKSTVRTYKANELNTICPFIATKAFQIKSSSPYSFLDDIDSMMMDYQSGKCYVTTLAGDTKTCRLSFAEGEPYYQSITLKEKHPEYFDEGWSQYRFTNGCIGDVAITGGGINLVGKMFYYKGNYAIHLGAQKSDGTGEQYFAYFTNPEM